MNNNNNTIHYQHHHHLPPPPPLPRNLRHISQLPQKRLERPTKGNISARGSGSGSGTPFPVGAQGVCYYTLHPSHPCRYTRKRRCQKSFSFIDITKNLTIYRSHARHIFRTMRGSLKGRGAGACVLFDVPWDMDARDDQHSSSTSSFSPSASRCVCWRERERYAPLPRNRIRSSSSNRRISRRNWPFCLCTFIIVRFGNVSHAAILLPVSLFSRTHSLHRVLVGLHRNE